MPISSAPLTRRAISTAMSASVPSARSTGGDVSRTERHERAGRIDDDAAPLEADQRDEQADAGADRVFERIGHGDDDALAQADARGENEDACPAIATAPSATGHGVPRAATTVNAKKKLCPIAGATPIG